MRPVKHTSELGIVFRSVCVYARLLESGRNECRGDEGRGVILRILADGRKDRTDSGKSRSARRSSRHAERLTGTEFEGRVSERNRFSSFFEFKLSESKRYAGGSS